MEMGKYIVTVILVLGIVIAVFMIHNMYREEQARGQETTSVAELLGTYRDLYRPPLPSDPAIDALEQRVRENISRYIDEFPVLYNSVQGILNGTAAEILNNTYQVYMNLDKYSSYGKLMAYLGIYASTVWMRYYLAENKTAFKEELSRNLTQAAARLHEIDSDLNYTYNNMGVYYANKKLGLIILLEQVYSSASKAQRQAAFISTMGADSLPSPIYLSGEILYYVFYLYPNLHDIIYSDCIDFNKTINISINDIYNKTRDISLKIGILYTKAYKLIKELKEKYGLSDTFIEYLKQKIKHRCVNKTGVDKKSIVYFYTVSIAMYAEAKAIYTSIEKLHGLFGENIELSISDLKQLKKTVNESSRNSTEEIRVDPVVASIMYQGGASWVIRSVEIFEEDVARESGLTYLLRYYYMGYYAYQEYFEELEKLCAQYLDPA